MVSRSLLFNLYMYIYMKGFVHITIELDIHRLNEKKRDIFSG